MEKAEMSGSSQRGQLRPNHSSRSPPFLVVGLLVVISILAFNYWSLSSTNKLIKDQLDTLGIKYRQQDQILKEREKSLTDDKNAIEKQKNQCRIDFDQLDNKLKAELAGCKSEIDNKVLENQQYRSEIDKLKQQDVEKDQSLQDNVENVQKLKLEVETLNAEIHKKTSEGQNCIQQQTNLQQQLDLLKNKLGDSRLCSEEVQSTRISLLTKLQELGGPQVLDLLAKAGVDTTGVAINSKNQQQGSDQNAEQKEKVEGGDSNIAVQANPPGSAVDVNQNQNPGSQVDPNQNPIQQNDPINSNKEETNPSLNNSKKQEVVEQSEPQRPVVEETKQENEDTVEKEQSVQNENQQQIVQDWAKNEQVSGVLVQPPMNPPLDDQQKPDSAQSNPQDQQQAPVAGDNTADEQKFEADQQEQQQVQEQVAPPDENQNVEEAKDDEHNAEEDVEPDDQLQQKDQYEEESTVAQEYEEEEGDEEEREVDGQQDEALKFQEDEEEEMEENDEFGRNNFQ